MLASVSRTLNYLGAILACEATVGLKLIYPALIGYNSELIKEPRKCSVSLDARIFS
jgi:hypothetical protein